MSGFRNFACFVVYKTFMHGCLFAAVKYLMEKYFAFTNEYILEINFLRSTECVMEKYFYFTSITIVLFTLIATE